MDEAWERKRQELAQQVRNAALDLLLHTGEKSSLVEVVVAEPGVSPMFVAIGDAINIRTLLLEE